MAKLTRKKGTVSFIAPIFIQDSSSATGAGLTGLTNASAGLVCRYLNPGGTLSASITLETITALGTYAAPTSNAHMRFKEVSNADPSKGVYEIQLHNDWMNLTGGSILIMLAGATNMAPLLLEIELTAVDNQDGVRMGLTALPNAAADAAGGLPISDAGGLDLDAKLANTNEVTVARMGALTDWINGGRLDLLLDAVKAVTDLLPDAGALSSLATAANLTTVIGYIDTEVAAILAAVDTEVGAIKAKTDQLTFTKANELDANTQSINDVTILGNGSSTPFQV